MQHAVDDDAGEHVSCRPERRWRTKIGYAPLDDSEAVVVLTRTKLVAIYASLGNAYDLRSLVPFLRTLE